MKKLLLIAVVMLAMGCNSHGQTSVVVAKVDSVKILLADIRVLQDSISILLDRPVMTESQFIKIYKYERLEKYYKLCVKRPSQWKYYKGWSIRVFNTGEPVSKADVNLARKRPFNN